MTCARHRETRSQCDSPMKLRRILERIKPGSDTFDAVKPLRIRRNYLRFRVALSSSERARISFISRAITKHVWKSLSAEIWRRNFVLSLRESFREIPRNSFVFFFFPSERDTLISGCSFPSFQLGAEAKHLAEEAETDESAEI